MALSNGKDSSRKLSMKMDTEVLEAFRLFDKDNDGLITKKEIVALITGLGGEADCPHLKVSSPLISLITFLAKKIM